YQLGFEEGQQEGRQEGHQEGRQAAEARFCAHLRLSVVQVLELRGFVLTDAQRERIAACDSLETL
ncbi:MAG: transposase, partial [Enhygromyxa sp.]